MDVQATQMRAGMMVRFRGDICTIHKMEHRTPGKGRGFVQVKMRNHRSGSMLDQRFASEDSWPALMVNPEARSYVRSMLERVSPMTPVISNAEIHRKVSLRTVATIGG